MKEGSYMSLHKAIIRVLAFVAGGIVVLLGLLDVYLMTKLPVSMIAGKVGFDNFSHFSQAFRKYSGKTPSEYR